MNPIVLATLAPLLFSVGAATSGTYVPSDAERARWTMSDMRSMATALEAYAIDHGGYPTGTTIGAIAAEIQPKYMRKAHVADAWGHPYVYVPSADRQSYRLVSAGADGRPDSASWAAAGQLADFEQDAVCETGKLTRPWPFL